MDSWIIESTSSFSNLHGVIDDNSNCYKSMVMDKIKMNQGYTSECSIVDEESNTNMAKFFEVLKDFDEPLQDGGINHSKLLIIL